MRPFVIAILLAFLAAATVTPTASAHVCNGDIDDCGACKKGEDHVHNDQGGGNCVSDESSLVENNYGKRGLPMPPVALLLVALGAVALTCPRRS